MCSGSLPPKQTYLHSSAALAPITLPLGYRIKADPLLLNSYAESYVLGTKKYYPKWLFCLYEKSHSDYDIDSCKSIT